MAEIVTWMTRVPPVDTSVVAAFKQWMSELPARAKKDGGGKEGGKKGKKK